MKVLLALLILMISFSAFPCKRSAEAFDSAAKAKLKEVWKTEARWQQPKYAALPFKLSSIEKDPNSTINYFVYINRGDTVCKRITYAVSGNEDCSIEASMVSVQGCPAK